MHGFHWDKPLDSQATSKRSEKKKQCFFLSQRQAGRVRSCQQTGREAVCLLATWWITKQRSSVIGRVPYRTKSTTHPWTLAFCKKKNFMFASWQAENVARAKWISKTVKNIETFFMVNKILTGWSKEDEDTTSTKWPGTNPVWPERKPLPNVAFHFYLGS